MKKKSAFFAVLILYVFCSGCKDNDSPTPKVLHAGDKWAISSFTYVLTSQKTNPVSMIIDAGTVSNAGYFYFNGQSGSFDITIKSTHIEDYLSYSESGNDITVAGISQSAGANVSQYVIALAGSKDGTVQMAIEGSITRQTTSEQFSLSGSMMLVKQ